MAKRSLITGILLSALAGSVLSLTIGLAVHRSDAASAASTSSVVHQSQKISDAAAQVPFAVKQPGWLPFTPKASWAHTLAPGHNPAIEVNFATSSSFVILTEIQANLVPTSDKFVITDVKLPGGTVAKFMDNSYAKILTWSDSEISYQLVASEDLTQDSLVKIAASLK